MRHHLVLRVVSKILIPFIILYGLYVQFHGDFSPGGGFQAGVIVAAAIILYALIFGIERARQVFKPEVLLVFAPLGVMIFALVGYAALALGGNYLDYDWLVANDTAGQHIGIITVEFGVGLTVAAVMTLIFLAYAGRTRDIDDEDW
ncbi:Na+/H+ antiporter MnhB subunit-related protein [alpha proteobacterium BAL199]|jgi:multicomponent Na+:H+ antiporter subunit B|nr:Na+/H+ antiporter MnhB subunit-related protein [alpha proteobacterium BAL199]